MHLFLKEEFKGEIKPFLAGDDIKSGDKWKESIKENLEIGDAIISIITPNSVNKPWLFVEWAAFWIADKDIHVFLSKDISHTDLIHPMQDFQYVNMTNVDAMKGFLQRLSSAAEFRPAPYDLAEDLVVRIKAADQLQKADNYKKSFDKYADKKEELPTEDLEKQKIADYFICKNDLKTFNRVFETIKDDNVKSKVIATLIKAKQYGTAVQSAIGLRVPELQRVLVIDLMDEDIDQQIIYPLIESVAKKNQPQLRIILTELIDTNREGGELFSKVFSLTDNTPTLHKVASYLIENDKFESATFQKIAAKIYTNNAAEARKLGEELINGGLEDSEQFDKIVRGMAKKNQIETVKLLKKLKSSNPGLFKKYRESGIITSASAIARLDAEDEE